MTFTKNKIEPIIAKKEVKDGFDIEFLLRKSTNLPTYEITKTCQICRYVQLFPKTVTNLVTVF